jgi:hypothetical protein
MLKDRSSPALCFTEGSHSASLALPWLAPRPASAWRSAHYIIEKPRKQLMR